MSLTITAAQRDALYDQILDRLGGIDDINLVIGKGDFETAQRLAVEYADDLRLISESLGWGGRSAQSVDLKVALEVLRRAIPRHKEMAEAREENEQEQRAEAREAECRNRLVMQACREVLMELGDRP